jgi:hypothetical protein
MSNRRLPAPDAPGGALPDVIDDLHAEGHLTQRQHQAALLFLRELQASCGRSAGLVMDISERVDTSRRPASRPPGGPSVAHLDQRLNRLHGHERQLMAHLVRSRELARGKLSDYGRTRSAYATQKTARAFAVGRVSALLDSLADTYLGPIETE